ncbi:LOW QUALITY PROTEIN: uncharacterized protein ACN427_007240 [Glossina fuscipes fuscipes]
MSLLHLKGRVLVKSGGFSTQLAKHVGDKIIRDLLRGSRFDKENPEAVTQTHLDFLEFEIGADIIVTNTYQSSVEGFTKHLNLTKEESIDLMRESVKLAMQAKNKYLERLKDCNRHKEPLPLIMGSIDRYGAMLHDGSEYTGSYTEKLTKRQIQQWHRTRIEAVLSGVVDGLVVETILCQMEAEAVTEMLLKDYADVKFWVSFQCKDELLLAHGQNFANSAKSVWELIRKSNAVDRLYCIGVNCVNPKMRNTHKCLQYLQASQVRNKAKMYYDDMEGAFYANDREVNFSRNQGRYKAGTVEIW